jgi:tyrosine phenol-lyase
MALRFYGDEQFPLEMHKVRVIQKMNLVPIERRLEAATEAGNNTFLLKNKDIFLDMLTDSGVNAMSDRQVAEMLKVDDSYAGSATWDECEAVIQDMFGMQYVLPVHQGRAAENILGRTYVTEGTVVPMNYHFTTSKVHVTLNGGAVEEIYHDDALDSVSSKPFKGDMDPAKLEELIKRWGADKVAFVRMESGTNLIGGQPHSLANLREVGKICRANGIKLIYDASLMADNLYFLKSREEECKNMSTREIIRALAAEADIVYFSARKLGCVRGGAIVLRDRDEMMRMRDFIPLYEGFMSYGGMSLREVGAMTVGLQETYDEEMYAQGPQFIQYFVDEMVKRGIPCITPAGGLGAHVDAMAFLDHIPVEEYRAGALASAMYLASGCRGMERGTLSEQREPDGSEIYSKMELLRMAMPRRVFTMSQVKYTVDRLHWLYDNRNLVGGLKWDEEPAVLRFFFGRLVPTSDWQQKLVAKFRADFGDSL